MNMTELDQTVDQVLAGDIDAYEFIVDAYQQEVWKVVSAMLLNEQRTEDLVAQAFTRAFQQLHRYQKGRPFGPWIKEIARNEVRQELRRSLREDRRMEIYSSHLLREYETPSASNKEALLDQALAECVGGLARSSAELVELRYHAGLNFGELATRIGRTVEATRQQLARIRLALRDCIEKRLAQP
jgi:RNA polymerase sigma-70 factor (ECF subfamily)